MDQDGGQARALAWLRAPAGAVVVALAVRDGEPVAAGATLLLLEAMKMELPLAAPGPGRVHRFAVAPGDAVAEGQPLLLFEVDQGLAEAGRAAAEPASRAAAGPQVPAPDGDAALAHLQARRALLSDAARPEAVARRHARGRRTARENVADLLDPGSLAEYGAFAVAAQRSRRPLEALQRETPADGLVCGHGTRAGRPLAVLAYDYTVLAGTQGVFNHAKADRLLDLAARQRWPLVLFAEGGGGRPGDVDWPGVAGLDCTTFARLAALSGQVPLVGIAAGYCFAGNAALLACCDVVIATAGSSLGLGGPAMIEGGGLGRVAPQDVGPAAELAAAGAIDLLVPDEAAAVAAAKQVLALLGGEVVPAQAPARAPETLRAALPANRSAVFEPAALLAAVVDADSLLELRPGFGRGLLTALARIEGRPVALLASRPQPLGGALDAPACDKLARFQQLADAHGLPLLSFIDCPGFMVGPDSERMAMLRHAGRVFVGGAALRVPRLAVVLRRGFGLGAMALAGGHFHVPLAICAWPGAEFGAMGLEGAVRLGYRKELEAAPDEAAREALYQRLLAEARDKGAALNMASHLEIDDVIDPAETRDWLARHLRAAAATPLPPRRPFVDAW